MAATVTAVGNTWTQVAANIAAVTLIQCTCPGLCEIEILADAGTPAETDRGVRMAQRDTIGSTQIADIGGSGALWAKKLTGSDVEVITL